jgi:hypothetical protein
MYSVKPWDPTSIHESSERRRRNSKLLTHPIISQVPSSRQSIQVRKSRLKSRLPVVESAETV